LRFGVTEIPLQAGSEASRALAERTPDRALEAHRGTITRRRSLRSGSQREEEREAREDAVARLHREPPLDRPAFRELQLSRRGWPSRSTPTSTPRARAVRAELDLHQEGAAEGAEAETLGPVMNTDPLEPRLDRAERAAQVEPVVRARRA
jgi:hypothetical protein